MSDINKLYQRMYMRSEANKRRFTRDLEEADEQVLQANGKMHDFLNELGALANDADQRSAIVAASEALRVL